MVNSIQFKIVLLVLLFANLLFANEIVPLAEGAASILLPEGCYHFSVNGREINHDSTKLITDLVPGTFILEYSGSVNARDTVVLSCGELLRYAPDNTKVIKFLDSASKSVPVFYCNGGKKRAKGLKIGGVILMSGGIFGIVTGVGGTGLCLAIAGEDNGYAVGLAMLFAAGGAGSIGMTIGGARMIKKSKAIRRGVALVPVINPLSGKYGTQFSFQF